MKIVLVHGYGVGETKRLGYDLSLHGGFEAFEELIRKKQSTVYRWHTDPRKSLIDQINPLKSLALYQYERSLVFSDPKVVNNLANLINKEKPTHLIGHSLGTVIINKYLHEHKVETSLKKVVTIQSDLPSNQPITIDFKDKLIWENYYCWWDPALLSISVYHKNIRAGLVGLKSDKVKNIFLPLYSRPNPHVCSIRNKRNIKRFLNLD